MRLLLPSLRGVRARTAAAAAVAVVVALGMTLPILGLSVNRRVESSIDDQLRDRARSMAPLVEEGSAPAAVTAAGPDVFAQVVSARGDIAAATPGLEDLAPFAAAFPPPGSFISEETGSLIEGLEARVGREDEGPYRIVALGVATGEGPAVVQVAASLEAARNALSVVGSFVMYGAPLLAAAVAVLVWVLTGRSLAPVEAIRTEADKITASDLSRRVPVAATGDEVQRLGSTINAMLAHLDAAAGRQRRFVSDASHELKAPVATMRTILEVSGRDLNDETEHPVAADLLGEVTRLESLIGDLLVLARTDEGVPLREWSDVDLDQVAGSEAADASQRSGIGVDTSQIRAARIRGDAAGLRAAVRNLLDNAAAYASSKIAVAVAMDGGDAVVTVADDGPGIAAGQREQVFDRFHRGDPARSRGGGSGLGLAVVRAVARSHGGEAAVVESSLGGAAVEIRIPGARTAV